MRRFNQTFLFVYSLIVTVVLLVASIVFISNSNSSNKSFDEIQVQQIRVVEPDGTLRMIISNSKKLPGVIIHGKEQEKVDRPQAGMLFYNDEGSENGGLIFGGSKNEKGEIVNSGGSLSFDRYDAKEEVNLIGVNDKVNKFAGVAISDSKPGDRDNPQRIWIGRNPDGSSEIALMDGSGKKRIEFKVSENGESSITLSDTKGKIQSLLDQK